MAKAKQSKKTEKVRIQSVANPKKFITPRMYELRQANVDTLVTQLYHMDRKARDKFMYACDEAAVEARDIADAIKRGLTYYLKALPKKNDLEWVLDGVPAESAESLIETLRYNHRVLTDMANTAMVVQEDLWEKENNERPHCEHCGQPIKPKAAKKASR